MKRSKLRGESLFTFLGPNYIGNVKKIYNCFMVKSFIKAVFDTFCKEKSDILELKSS